MPLFRPTVCPGPGPVLQRNPNAFRAMRTANRSHSSTMGKERSAFVDGCGRREGRQGFLRCDLRVSPSVESRESSWREPRVVVSRVESRESKVVSWRPNVSPRLLHMHFIKYTLLTASLPPLHTRRAKLLYREPRPAKAKPCTTTASGPASAAPDCPRRLRAGRSTGALPT